MDTHVDSGSLLHILHCGLGHFRRFLTISHTLTLRSLRKLTDADKTMNPQYFWSDPDHD